MIICLHKTIPTDELLCQLENNQLDKTGIKLFSTNQYSVKVRAVNMRLLLCAVLVVAVSGVGLGSPLPFEEVSSAFSVHS